MSTFVLIHGAWHGGWCWSKVAQLLRQSGHPVLTPDLPGHGGDQTPVGEITLKKYADSVVALLDQQPAPVILVGHSMGGLVISEAAEKRPEKVKSLVYVCAFLLRNGETLGGVAGRDSHALVMPNLVVAQDQVSARVAEGMIRQTFYTNCSLNDASSAQSRLVPQALAPFMTPLQLTEARYGRVPRQYVECTHDRAISIGVQREMHANSPCRKIHTLETDHSPFLSAPQELASILITISGR
ncbi:MAG: alpha/beta fold hydrolase [Ignavibacteriales bacterium]|nr:alpha/beta fold hydrolase [Ignavibacteriales bacterium]